MDSGRLLCNAAAAGRLRRVCQLLDEGVDVNTIDSETRATPLYLAVRYDRDDVVRELIKRGADANFVCVNVSALYCAVKEGFAECVQALLDAPDIDANVQTVRGKGAPLHVAALVQRAEVLRIMLESPKVDVNAVDEEGRTALHYAMKHGRIRAVRMLLASSRVDPVKRDLTGAPAVWEAIVGERSDCLTAFIDGAPPTAWSFENDIVPLFTAIDFFSRMQSNEHTHTARNIAVAFAEAGVCLGCGQRKRLLMCKGCATARFCSDTCQKVAWRRDHRTLCPKIKESRNGS
jgi:hypothetical protein